MDGIAQSGGGDQRLELQRVARLERLVFLRQVFTIVVMVIPRPEALVIPEYDPFKPA